MWRFYSMIIIGERYKATWHDPGFLDSSIINFSGQHCSINCGLTTQSDTTWVPINRQRTKKILLQMGPLGSDLLD